MAAKYSDTLVTRDGSVLVGATLQLTNELGGFQTLYSDVNLTAPISPDPTIATTDSNGYAEFYVADGVYSINEVYGSVSVTRQNIQIYDLKALAARIGDATITAPGAPTLVATPGDGQVTITWTDGSNGGSAITQRLLLVGTTTGGEGAGTPISLTGGQYVYTPATNGQPYYFEGASVNVVGTGALSAEVTATPANAVILDSFDSTIWSFDSTITPTFDMTV